MKKLKTTKDKESKKVIAAKIQKAKKDNISQCFKFGKYNVIMDRYQYILAGDYAPLYFTRLWHVFWHLSRNCVDAKLPVQMELENIANELKKRDDRLIEAFKELVKQSPYVTDSPLEQE